MSQGERGNWFRCQVSLPCLLSAEVGFWIPGFLGFRISRTINLAEKSRMSHPPRKHPSIACAAGYQIIKCVIALRTVCPTASGPVGERPGRVGRRHTCVTERHQIFSSQNGRSSCSYQALIPHVLVVDVD